MIPDDAIERLLEGCQAIAKQCETQGIQEWEIVASQGYGRSLDIEAGRISLASGGGEGGFGGGVGAGDTPPVFSHSLH